MAQIRSKQIKDFLTTVNWAATSDSQIPNTADIKSYVDTTSQKLGDEVDASIDSLEVALAAEISATNSDFTELEASITVREAAQDLTREETRLALENETEQKAIALENETEQKASILEAARIQRAIELAVDVTAEISGSVKVESDRVDAILNAVDADPDSFKDVVSIINAVDLENDEALGAVLLALNIEISETNSDFVRVEGELAAEISATNSDFTALEIKHDGEMAAEGEAREQGDAALEAKLSAEISATDSDFVSLETKHDNEMQAEAQRREQGDAALEAKLSAEISATNSDFVRVETDLATLSTEVVDEVESIDVRLGLVSGDLVDSVDSLEVALAAEISATNSDFTELETSIAVRESNQDLTREETRIALEEETEQKAITLALETEQKASVIEAARIQRAAELAVDVTAEISGSVKVEANRIDAILNAVDADPDSFKDVVSIINAVDLENDEALAAVILALNSEISETNSDFVRVEAALTAEISATNSDFASLELRHDNELQTEAEVRELADAALEAALSAEISATNSDFVSLEIKHDGEMAAEGEAREQGDENLRVALEAEISATNSDVTRIDLKDGQQDARLATLEATIIEDNEMAVESYTGAGFNYTVAKQVQDDNKNLVEAYVNGHRVSVLSVAGTAVELADPNYTIDAEDTVVFVYQF